MKTILVFIFSLCLATCAFADGSITGTVKYEGMVPPKRFIPMEADPVCYAIHKGNIYLPSLLLGKGNTLGNTFVFIKSGLKQSVYPPPARPAVISQAGCDYHPHVIGVMAGQKVEFLNPDGTLHNVHAMCRINPQFNASMPPFRKEMEVTFKKPEFMFPVQCDVHPWMRAWMAVMPDPFFAVTGQDGKFVIKNVPDGTYVVEAWHERLGTKTATVKVGGNSSQKIDFTFSETN
ncbi:MAG: hypothetical protein KGJ09_06520 [Candidatus Omnitrophica bacterium]|nr:hypothetical protein [Candidatus Omnitrophota bacterium]MDE2213886.1 hypothetical protein [Candidatus Omnitrophota bacterium]